MAQLTRCHLATLLLLVLPVCSALAQAAETGRILLIAQNTACVANQAIAAGYDGYKWRSTSEMVDALLSGITVVSPDGQAVLYKVPLFNADEKARILPYLTLRTSPSLMVQFHADPHS